MPVESRDDLTSALADWDKYEPDASTDKIIRQANAVADAARGAAKRISELEAECAAKIENDLRSSTQIAKLVGQKAKWMDRAITAERELDTANANHRDMAARLKDMGTQLEQARSALAEERERCARIADNHVTASHFGIVAKRAIATAIRSGKPDGKE